MYYCTEFGEFVQRPKQKDDMEQLKERVRDHIEFKKVHVVSSAVSEFSKVLTLR